ncbi:MAG: FecR domain-containing protein [Candidatus Competibacteraceae bacterium]
MPLCHNKIIATTLCYCVLSSLLITCAQAQEWVYTVRSGDNPWSISRDYLQGMDYWPRLQRYNGITRPTRIPPGTQLRIPIEWLKNPIKPITARVLDVRGEVEVSSGETGKTAPLEVEHVLQAGDTIRTGPESSVRLKFHDDSELLLQADSTLTLETLHVYANSGLVDAQMHLQRGRLEAQATTRRDPAIRYEIRTPSAVAAVRGTEFRVGADDANQVALAEVTDGEVSLSSAGKVTVLPEKFGAVAKTGGGKPVKVELLPPPALAGFPATLEKLEFSWPELDGAQKYRVQLMAYQRKRFKLLVVNRGRLIHSEQVGGGEQVLALIYEKIVETPQFRVRNCLTTTTFCESGVSTSRGWKD